MPPDHRLQPNAGWRDSEPPRLKRSVSLRQSVDGHCQLSEESRVLKSLRLEATER